MPGLAPLVELVRDRRELPPPALRRQLREAGGLSLDEVAQSLGVTRQAVSRWENGTRFPRPPHLQNYAELLRELKKVAW